MKVLVLADVESKYYWDFFSKDKFEDIDLIISCGDLNADYLMFLVTLTNIPVLYVRGNHDYGYDQKPPEGCVCIEETIFEYKGVRFLGLPGSMQYDCRGIQFTEKQMREKVRKLKFKLWKSKGFDVLVTHAPAFELNDGEDMPHRGFKVFRDLLDKYSPKYFIHGHVHLNYGLKYPREDMYKDTKVINAYERYIIEI